MLQRFATGMVFSEEITLTPELVESFAQLSGDRNPVHLLADAAREFGYARPFAHGAILTAVVSRLIGMKVPGSGAVWMNHQIEWLKPIFVGDTVKVAAEIESLSTGAETLTLRLRATNQANDVVMQGGAKVKLAPKLTPAPKKESSTATRVALVTGGSRGIGAATALALGAAGLHVAISYQSQRAAADEVVQALAAAGTVGQSYAADFTVPESGHALVRQVERDLGRVDVVIHAATPPLLHREILALTAADIRHFHRVHVETAFELAQAAAPGMAARRFGRLIFLGTSALFGSPPAKMAAYISAKSALWGLVRCLASELGPQQITANLISPGLTVTDLTSEMPPRLKEAEARRVAVRRLARPEDVAPLAAFLASESAGYINGQNLPLTGGPV